MTPKESKLRLVFDRLQENEVDFIVLRGFQDIPDLVSYENDVDLLCKGADEVKLKAIFNRMNYKFHQDSELNNRYLYHARPHHHFRSKSKDLHFDVVFNLSYRSPNNDEWVSVHEELQESLWENKRRVNNFWLYQPSLIDEFIHLICHSIYDKKEFYSKHESRITELLQVIDQKEVVDKLQCVFFKFTPHLMEYIRVNNYSDIVSSYLSFNDY